MPIGIQSIFRLIALLLAVALSGCISKVEVDGTGATGSHVEYAYVTVTGVWLNTSDSALTSDSGWVGKELATPITIDLTTLNNGTVTRLLSGVTLPQGTYRQLRLVLADNTAALTSSASSLSLSNNAVVQYLDSTGTLTTVPLELANPNGEMVLPISLKINVVSNVLSASASSGSSSSSSSTSSNASGGTTTITNLVLDVNALRGLSIFDYSGQAGVLFDPKLSGYNADDVGSITGSLDLSAIAYAQRTSSQGVVVTAETLSEDGSRYIEVKSTAISSSGSFTLYPLPAADSTTYYDLVIHGNGVQPVVIASVPVTKGGTTSVQSSAITLAVADTYPVNTTVTAGSVPASTDVSFYQTLPDTSLPRLIEFAKLNPYSGRFSEDIVLPVSTVIYGLYSDGDDIAFATVAPDEGVGSYQLVTRAPLHAMSAFGDTVTSSSTATTVDITLPTMGLDAGATAATVSGTVTLNTVGYYDRGFALISQGGRLIDVLKLDDALAATGASGHADFSFSNVPGGIPQAVYDVSVRLWNSSNPASTLARVGASTPADLRSGSSAQVSIAAP